MATSHLSCNYDFFEKICEVQPISPPIDEGIQSIEAEKPGKDKSEGEVEEQI